MRLGAIVRWRPGLLAGLAKTAGVLLVFFAAACAARADNIVLKNGQRLNVTGYRLVGNKYRLQMNGGFVEVAFEDVASIEPEDIFAVPPSPAPAVSKLQYRDLVETSASRWHVDADLISSVIATESNFNARAVSRKNARGLMQLMPATAARLGVHDIFDPQQNIDAGTQYLGNLLARYRNDWSLALAAYNAGPERVQQYGRVPPFAETLSYVRRVQKNYQSTKTVPAKKKGSVTPAAVVGRPDAATTGTKTTDQ
jgi:soluble lytic murein transglycosylase-like protein